MNNDRPDGPEHDQDVGRERGEDPEVVVGHTPDRPPGDEPHSNFEPDPDAGDRWRRMADDIGKEHRPRREDVYPYLLVRAFAPGDRGQRPLWPPVVCWESPDILLIDATYAGPFDPSRLVAAPVAGRSYRVFIRVWNLGLLPAVGVHVQAWAVAAGFFGSGNQNDPYYQQHHIGGTWIDQLADRRSPDAVTITELDRLWQIDSGEIGHFCLIASVSCPTDHFSGPLLVNQHRHVGQRNLNILAPTQSAAKTVGLLAGLVPHGFTLELTHGGPAAVPLLQALGGGDRLFGERDRGVPIVAPATTAIRGGLNIGASAHLLTAFESDGMTVVVGSVALEKLAARTRFGRTKVSENSAGRTHPFAAAGGTRRTMEQLGPKRWGEIGVVTDQPLAEALIEGIARVLDVGEAMDGAALGAALGSSEAQHLLRFTLTGPEGDLVGGYSLVVGNTG